MTCYHCRVPMIGKFCAECGQPAQVRRINGRYIVDELRNIFFLEKGIFYTIKELLLRPGINIRKFLLHDRHRLVKPIVFIILTSLIYSLSNIIFPFEDNYITYGDFKSSYTKEIFNWITSNYGYSNLLMGIFIAPWVRLMFRKYKYNFFEILVMLCFVLGMAMVILAVFGIFEYFLNVQGSIVFLVYLTWAIASFFELKFVNVLKALFSYVIGTMTFVLIGYLTGAFLDKFF